MKTIRIYGKITKIKEDCYKVEYRDYTEGKCVWGGTEEFTLERLMTDTKKFDVYCYNGRLTRAGGKMAVWSGSMRIAEGNSKLEAAKIVYGEEKVARVGKTYRYGA